MEQEGLWLDKLFIVGTNFLPLNNSVMGEWQGDNYLPFLKK